jgi:hypothetical protein
MIPIYQNIQSSESLKQEVASGFRSGYTKAKGLHNYMGHTMLSSHEGYTYLLKPPRLLPNVKLSYLEHYLGIKFGY